MADHLLGEHGSDGVNLVEQTQQIINGEDTTKEALETLRALVRGETKDLVLMDLQLLREWQKHFDGIDQTLLCETIYSHVSVALKQAGFRSSPLVDQFFEQVFLPQYLLDRHEINMVRHARVNSVMAALGVRDCLINQDFLNYDLENKWLYGGAKLYRLAIAVAANLKEESSG